MPQPAGLAPNFCRSVHRVTSHLTKWPHCIPTLSALPPAHSCTFSVHIVLTSAQQMQLMWQPDACDTANALKSSCALAPSLFLCYAESNKMPKPKLVLIQFISFYGVWGTAGDSTGDWSIWEGVSHQLSSHQFLHDSGTTISHQFTELEVAL